MSDWQEFVRHYLHEEIRQVRSVGGGCIAEAWRATLQSGRRLFVKTHVNGADMFRKETSGLRELAKSGAFTIPEVVGCGEDFLILEEIRSAPRPADFMATFGRQFAQLHRFGGTAFGFFENNYIGASVQKNTPALSNPSAWPEFFYEYRLLFQYRLAERNGLADSQMGALMAKLETRIHHYLDGTDEAPALLHGDLWSGNYLVGSQGEPCLIDPAVYYGHREADLAMTRLFGGFDEAFYQSYHEAYPLMPQADERVELYQLYHLMNHLNLFGASYYPSCIRLLEKYGKGLGLT
jgi:fructosamine-3-kinase